MEKELGQSSLHCPSGAKANLRGGAICTEHGYSTSGEKLKNKHEGARVAPNITFLPMMGGEDEAVASSTA